MFSELALKILKRLYPKGRAFRNNENSSIHKVHEAISIIQGNLLSDSKSILNSILPDNDLFTEDDATNWEVRLGLITNTSISLNNRKLAIFRKMNHPGNIPARQHFLYLEYQLRLAGFDVYVHENRFFDSVNNRYFSKSPSEILSGVGLTTGASHSDNLQHGQLQHGSNFSGKIVNSLDSNIDAVFNEGVNNYNSTFFIGGLNLGDFAEIESDRELEFRHLVLRIKPVQSVAYLFADLIISGDFNNDFNNDFST